MASAITGTASYLGSATTGKITMTKETQQKSESSNSKSNHGRTVLILAVVVIAMFGFGFAMVPLYNVLCNVTGLNGKTSNQAVALGNTHIDKSRTITVEFVASNNGNLPWQFRPLVRKIKLHPGENKRVAFFAKNESRQTMTVQAIPSVAPGDAARYLQKTECFCFNQQTLKSGEEMDMPLIFHIDPGLPKNIKILTLSYTLFDAGPYKSQPASKTGKIRY